MGDLKHYLTNQPLKAKFKSQFDLVTHAIIKAEHMIKAGKVPDPTAEVKNFSHQILQGILDNTDNFVGRDVYDEYLAQQGVKDAIVEEANKKRGGAEATDE